MAACAPGAAAAQAALGGPDKPFTIGLREVTSYDSNPARGNTTDEAIRGIKPDEVTFSPSLTAVYSHSVGSHGLALTADFGYDYHSKNDSLSSEHVDFSAIGNIAVGALCSVGGGADYGRSQSDLQTLTVNVTHNIIQTYRISGSESCRSSGGLTENVELSHSATQNTSAGLVNSDLSTVSGLIGYTNAAIGTVGLTLSYARTGYGSDPLGALGDTPDSMEVTSYGVQLSRPIGARLTGTASVSYSHSVDRMRPGALTFGVTQFSGLTSSVGLSYLVGPRLRLNTHVQRGVSASVLQGIGYSVVTSADLGAEYTVSSRITASLGGNWAHTAYQGRDPLVIQTTPNWQDMNTIYARTTLTLGRRWGASLEVHRTAGRADLSLYDYVSNYVGLTLSTSL